MYQAHTSEAAAALAVVVERYYGASNYYNRAVEAWKELCARDRDSKRYDALTTRRIWSNRDYRAQVVDSIVYWESIPDTFFTNVRRDGTPFVLAEHIADLYDQWWDDSQGRPDERDTAAYAAWQARANRTLDERLRFKVPDFWILDDRWERVIIDAAFEAAKEAKA